MAASAGIDPDNTAHPRSIPGFLVEAIVNLLLSDRPACGSPHSDVAAIRSADSAKPHRLAPVTTGATLTIWISMGFDTDQRATISEREFANQTLEPAMLL
jgi:hypothetical protein